MDKTDRRSLNATVPPAATSARSASNTWAGMPTGVLLCAADGESSDSQRGFAKDDYRADLKIACDGFEVVENKFGLLEGAAPGRAPNKQKRQAGRPTAGEQRAEVGIRADEHTIFDLCRFDDRLVRGTGEPELPHADDIVSGVPEQTGELW
jgi:hypothetical protein